MGESRDRQFEIFRSKIAREIDAYFDQEPRPRIEMVVDYFGVHELLVRLPRRGAVTLDVKELKRVLAEKAWKEGGMDAELLFPLYIDQTVTPPDKKEMTMDGEHEFKEAETIPRTQYLEELLRKNKIIFNRPIGGKNKKDMMRGDHSYFFFYLPEYNIAININNQSGNASFVFYGVPDYNTVFSLTSISKEGYSDRDKNPYECIKIEWTGEKETWQARMLEAIQYQHILSEEILSTNSNEIPEGAKKDFKVRLAVLEQAYRQWAAEPEEFRGDFTASWLKDNGYNGLYVWARKRFGGIKKLVAFASQAVQEAFVSKIERRTPERSLKELKQAYDTWVGQPEDSRGPFNVKWMRDNGFYALYEWTKKNGGIDAFVAQAPQYIQDAFEATYRKKTRETALEELEQAYRQWIEQPEETREPFNTAWLKNNGFEHTYTYARRNSGIEALVQDAPDYIQRVFEKRDLVFRTAETALEELEQAYREWIEESKLDDKPFSPKWLVDSGYSLLYYWALRNGGIDTLVAQASPDVQDAFTIRK